MSEPTFFYKYFILKPVWFFIAYLILLDIIIQVLPLEWKKYLMYILAVALIIFLVVYHTYLKKTKWEQKTIKKLYDYYKQLIEEKKHPLYFLPAKTVKTVNWFIGAPFLVVLFLLFYGFYVQFTYINPGQMYLKFKRKK